MVKRVRGGPPDDYERRQSEIVGKKAKQIMNDAPSPQIGSTWAKNFVRDAENNKMSISASKNREDPMDADGYAKGGLVGYRSAAMTKSVNMHGRGGKGR